MSIPDEKTRLRREIKSRRSCIPENERDDASLALAQHLWPFLQEQRIQQIAVYLATPNEISLDPLIETLLDAALRVSAPRVNLQSNTMAFFHLPSLDDVETGPWNLRQPNSREEITPDLILVPGLAFDTRGHRLGMGAGWYDQTLAPNMTTVGVCYDWQIIPNVPTETHDHPMNWVFTDKRQFGPFYNGNHMNS